MKYFIDYSTRKTKIERTEEAFYQDADEIGKTNKIIIYLSNAPTDYNFYISLAFELADRTHSFLMTTDALLDDESDKIELDGVSYNIYSFTLNSSNLRCPGPLKITCWINIKTNFSSIDPITKIPLFNDNINVIGTTRYKNDVVVLGEDGTYNVISDFLENFNELLQRTDSIKEFDNLKKKFNEFMSGTSSDNIVNTLTEIQQALDEKLDKKDYINLDDITF